MGVDSLLITLLLVLITMRTYGIGFDADQSFITGIQLWEREEDEEMEPLSTSEVPIWRSSGAAKIPVNVDSFGAAGDGIADDTQVNLSPFQKNIALDNLAGLILNPAKSNQD